MSLYFQSHWEVYASVISSHRTMGTRRRSTCRPRAEATDSGSSCTATSNTMRSRKQTWTEAYVWSIMCAEYVPHARFGGLSLNSSVPVYMHICIDVVCDLLTRHCAPCPVDVSIYRCGRATPRSKTYVVIKRVGYATQAVLAGVVAALF